MDDYMQMFSFLATPLGVVMRWMYELLQNYGWTIILFTILVRLITLPLTIKQQKSTARMSAYQPMIQEIQKKWASDKNKQNAEMQKFYEENNLKMTAGCLPMAVNMVVLFGIIAVIQAPLNYVIGMPEDQIANGVSIVEQYNPDLEISKSPYSQQSLLIGEMRNPETRDNFITDQEITDADGNKKMVKVDLEWVEKVDDFNFNFMGMNLSKVPTKVPKSELPLYLIIPILSVLTMFASQFIMAKTSGNQQQMKGSMMVMTLVMGVWFGYISFTIPVGFSLYYSVSNIVMTAQQILVRKIYDPDKIRTEVEAEIEERKKAKKAKKKVAIIEASGEVIEKEFTETELAKTRLMRARQLDAERYGEIDETPNESKITFDKARELDEKKYDNNTNNSDKTDSIKEEKEQEIPVIETEDDAKDEKEPYKPGRRKRARSNREREDEERSNG